MRQTRLGILLEIPEEEKYRIFNEDKYKLIYKKEEYAVLIGRHIVHVDFYAYEKEVEINTDAIWETVAVPNKFESSIINMKDFMFIYKICDSGKEYKFQFIGKDDDIEDFIKNTRKIVIEKEFPCRKNSYIHWFLQFFRQF